MCAITLLKNLKPKKFAENTFTRNERQIINVAMTYAACDDKLKQVHIITNIIDKLLNIRKSASLLS